MSFDNPKAVEIYTKKTELFPIEKQILDQLKKNATVLDLGCGTGRTTRHLADMGHHVIGIDISPLMIQKAHELHPDIAFKVGDATKLDFPDNIFDAVLFSFNGLDCIYPETQRTEALKEIHRVLKNGGVFIYSSHEWGATRFKWRALRRIRPYDGQYKRERTIFGDLILFYGSRETNIQQLKQAGFTDIEYYPLDGRMWRYYTCQKKIKHLEGIK